MRQFGFFKTRQPTTVINPLGIGHMRSAESESTVVIGRSDDLEKTVAIVLGQAQSEAKAVAVLPILGEDGFGKATLTQLIYTDARIQSHFQVKSWVRVYDKLNIAHVTKSITDLTTMGPVPVLMDAMDLIRQCLWAELTGKRYLLVLINVLNEKTDNWEQLKPVLDCGCPGIMILVTTRSFKVASIMGTMTEYILKELNDDDMWGIFRQRAFGMGVHEWPKLVEIGKQLMNKCCGSPLAATILGGSLSYKNDEREWLDVLESNIWDDVAVDNQIVPVLKMGYLSSPSYMKRYFAICAIFPKDFEIDRDTLIELWMAHSFIPSGGETEMEAKGIEVFNELAWRGFFQDVKKKRKKMGFIVCRMHDLIHDFEKSVVGSEYASLLNLYQQNNLSTETLHMSTCYKPGIVSILQRFSFIHTLLDFGYTVDLNERIIDYLRQSHLLDLSTANSLRAVSLYCTSISHIHDIPKILKHLRYLDLSDCSFSMELPESSSTLYSLQTLNLNNCRDLECLPKGMRHMRSLRYLYLDGCFVLGRALATWSW
ncbi:hypothetical protein LUZ63_008771 [Rhynchospora breviuscula]|uniref:NB-ARC domain-containing protein n=1 Tax=Rhynchospora breviuscula TaxID=2022672 RepID=A0A9Q0CDU9_9POAL|nr:hypothetical protein LUZ63_008771 [Rhynchospora breviuscula]